jgi:hypothetical protein
VVLSEVSCYRRYSPDRFAKLMQLRAVTMVRDEEDIIELFVRHTLSHVDALHVAIHQSMDSTPAILRLLEQEGLPVIATVVPDKVFRQGAMLSALARQAFHAGADMVFVIDADEFLRAPPRDRLEKRLGALPDDAVGAIPWQIYVPLPDDYDDPNTLTRITHRPIEERKLLGKVVLGPTFARDESLLLLEGAHWVYQLQNGDYVPKTLNVMLDIQLAHFPVRSVGQAVAKLLQRRWQRRIAWVDEPISKLVAAGFRSMLDRMTEIVLERGTLTPQELSWFAYEYNSDYRSDDVAPVSTYEHLLIRDPVSANPLVQRYADQRSNPLASLYRWLDGII